VDSSVLLAGVRVGRDCRIRRAIVDKWVQIPDGTEIGYDLEADASRFTVTSSGIVVVPHGYDFETGAVLPPSAKAAVR
jgi:glucose-1-phosphate adenylyltransferase